MAPYAIKHPDWVSIQSLIHSAAVFTVCEIGESFLVRVEIRILIKYLKIINLILCLIKSLTV